MFDPYEQKVFIIECPVCGQNQFVCWSMIRPHFRTREIYVRGSKYDTQTVACSGSGRVVSTEKLRSVNV